MLNILLNIISALGGLARNSVVLWLLGFRLRKIFTIYIFNLVKANFLFLSGQIIGSPETHITSCHNPTPSFSTLPLSLPTSQA
ncbi:hypothetical protein J1605_014336 [Eschrichtius robustus]|uniref:Uncharacterized protein n=1 Tax=Eschrichtius robustus TaxID=9764 RepID=A0AB34GEY5_ESCRO|nr:hypothetical protein J1605_014336 [Eschrichtius robustus]